MISISNEFDAEKYKEASKQIWDEVSPGWHKWTPVMSEMLRDSTNTMLDRADIGQGVKVLDIAAGDGDQSIIVAKRVGKTGSILATDISVNLLNYALSTAKTMGLTNLKIKTMDAENLELEDGSFDSVICRNGLMLVPDSKKALSEILRVLKPGGKFAGIVFSTPDKNPWISIPGMIATQKANRLPPKPGEPGLFSLGSPGMIEGLLNEVGFRDVQVTYYSVPFQLPLGDDVVEFLRDIAGALHAISSPLTAEEQNNAWNEIGLALQKFNGPDGFRAPGESIIVSGTK